jgi:hypothetical protein
MDIACGIPRAKSPVRLNTTDSTVLIAQRTYDTGAVALEAIGQAQRQRVVTEDRTWVLWSPLMQRTMARGPNMSWVGRTPKIDQVNNRRRAAD